MGGVEVMTDQLVERVVHRSQAWLDVSDWQRMKIPASLWPDIESCKDCHVSELDGSRLCCAQSPKRFHSRPWRDADREGPSAQAGVCQRTPETSATIV